MTIIERTKVSIDRSRASFNFELKKGSINIPKIPCASHDDQNNAVCSEAISSKPTRVNADPLTHVEFSALPSALYAKITYHFEKYEGIA